MDDLVGKVAIVTEASKALGADIARTLAQAGVSVVLNYSSDWKSAEAVVCEIERNGGAAMAIEADMTVASDVSRLLDRTLQSFGRLDILVNNASVSCFGAQGQFTEEEFHRVFNKKVLGALLASRAALKAFNPQGGHIVNVASITARDSALAPLVHASAIASVEAITRILAAELASRRIRVHTVSSGFKGNSKPSAMNETDLHRVVQTEQIGREVLNLCGERACQTTADRFQVSAAN